MWGLWSGGACPGRRLNPAGNRSLALYGLSIGSAVDSADDGSATGVGDSGLLHSGGHLGISLDGSCVSWPRGSGRAGFTLSVDVVAVRWSCFTCEATSIGPPDQLPPRWFELAAPPWRAAHPPRHYCGVHAERGRDLQRRRRAKYAASTLDVSPEQFEAVRSELKRVTVRLDQLRFSAGRATDREID